MTSYRTICQHGATLEAKLQAAIWQSCHSGQRDWHIISKLEFERAAILKAQLNFTESLLS